LRGGYDDFQHRALLPTIKDDALALSEQVGTKGLRKVPCPGRKGLSGRDIGHRDEVLARSSRVRAATANNLAEVEEFALAENAKFDPPLEHRQALQKAAQAIKYKEEGRLMLPGTEPWCPVRRSEFELFVKCPIEFRLLVWIRQSHGASPQKEFALAVHALAKKLGCGTAGASLAIKNLILHGFIECVYVGGRRKGDASRYRQVCQSGRLRM
jgi:hypothetical protein